MPDSKRRRRLAHDLQPPLVHVRVRDALPRADAVGGDAEQQPDGGDDEADGEDHELGAGEDEGGGAVAQGGELVVDGGLRGRVVGQDDLGGEDAGEEGGLVEGDVCADGGAGAVRGGEGEGGEDEGLDGGPGSVVV